MIYIVRIQLNYTFYYWNPHASYRVSECLQVRMYLNVQSYIRLSGARVLIKSVPTGRKESDISVL